MTGKRADSTEVRPEGESRAKGDTTRLIHLLLNRRLSLCFYAHALII